jgi:hypothetical protein
MQRAVHSLAPLEEAASGPPLGVFPSPAEPRTPAPAGPAA